MNLYIASSTKLSEMRHLRVSMLNKPRLVADFKLHSTKSPFFADQKQLVAAVDCAAVGVQYSFCSRKRNKWRKVAASLN